MQTFNSSIAYYYYQAGYSVGGYNLMCKMFAGNAGK